jgi:type VI secretion system protein VasD
MRVRSIGFFLCAVCTVVLLAGCAGTDPKPREAVRLDLTVTAAAGVNPDAGGRASPIAVRVYELKDDTAFRQADFFTLQDKEKAVVGDDILKRDAFMLRPGEHHRIVRTMNVGTTSLGIIAAYRDLPNSVWRANWPVNAPEKAWYRMFAPKLKLAVTLDTNVIKIDGPK